MESPQVQTAAAYRGDLMVFASAVGSVDPAARETAMAERGGARGGRVRNQYNLVRWYYRILGSENPVEVCELWNQSKALVPQCQFEFAVD